MNCSFLRFVYLSVFLNLLLVGCSGGESGTGMTASESKASVGVITGFGSVYVNGDKFDTSGAEINVNDAAAVEADLSIGMVVTIVGTQSRGTAKAHAIYYESEVCGIVSQNNQDGTLDIMGQTVKYDSETVFESDDLTITVIEDIPMDAVVEISGYRTGDNNLHATRIALVSDVYAIGEELAVKGIVTAGLSNGKFSMGSLTVAVDSATKFIDMPNQQITQGMVVKVKSKRAVLHNELQADTIKSGTNDHVAVGSMVEIEGIVMNPLMDSNEFQLNGFTVYFSNQTDFDGGIASDLADGVKAEVEGVLLSANQIEANEISFRKTARLELIAPATSIDDNQVDVSGVAVHLTSKTLLKDDDKATKVRRFSLADLSVGDTVKIKAYKDNLSGEVVATQFRRKEAVLSGTPSTTFELSGVLDELNNRQVVISGVAIDRSQVTELTSEEIGTQATARGTIPITVQ